MTDDASNPSLDAQRQETQASLRAELAAQIVAVQSELGAELNALRLIGGDDSSLTQELQNQLSTLKLLSQSISSASLTSLAQMRADVSNAVAASNAVAQQAQAANAQSVAATAIASYLQCTATLDAKVAATYAADQRNNDLAHDVAKRAGIDLTNFDQERADLEKQKADAIARGDKVAERQADVLIAQNTLNSMATGADSITDPDERRRYLAAMEEQQRLLEIRNAALAKQLELDATLSAASMKLSPAAAIAYVEQRKTEGIAAKDARAQELATDSKSSASIAQREAEIRKADEGGISAQITPLPLEPVLPLKEQSPAPIEAVSDEVKAAYHAAASAGAFQISFSQQPSTIALSTANNAHTQIEAPRLARAGSALGQALG